MRIGLFIPCYIDQFYPQVGIASLRLLERLGLDVSYPADQTCCGQPMANAGYEKLATGCNRLFAENFSNFEYIVSPSGSCVLHVRHQLGSNGNDTELPGKIFELSEFLTDVLQVQALDASFPHKVGLHQSCHGQRGLKLSQMTELVAADFSKPRKLLSMVQGLELISLDRQDECCGFGGSFCVTEEAVSVKMGKDRVTDHVYHGAEYITGADMSCLMHLDGILRRQRQKVKVIHIAEILNAQV